MKFVVRHRPSDIDDNENLLRIEANSKEEVIEIVKQKIEKAEGWEDFAGKTTPTLNDIYEYPDEFWSRFLSSYEE